MDEHRARDVGRGGARQVGLLAAPIFIALAAILSVYVDSGSPLEGVYRPVAVVLVLVVVAEASLVPLVGLRYASAVTSGLVLLVFKEYGVVALLVAVVVVAALSSRLGGRERTAHRLVLDRAIPAVALILLIVIVGKGMAEGALGVPDAPRTGAAEHEVGPDIIIVMLDGYPRSDTLSDAFAYDNEFFVDGLEQRGFDVSEQSHSNYHLTGLTFASMFEMRHIPDITSLAHETGYIQGYRALIRHVSGQLPALEILREHRYETVAIQSIVNEFKLTTADRIVDGGQMVQLETVLLGKTLLAPLVNWIAPDLLFDQQRERSLDAIASIEEAAADERKQFVFAHLMLPHAPFVFGPRGEPLPQPECLPTCSIFTPPVEHEEWLRLYRGQVEFVNGRLLHLVDTIQAHERGHVIVLLSDHGSRGFQAEEPEEMLLNFFAASTPGAPGLFPEDATPINLFPRLFSAYLDEPVPLQPDHLFMPSGTGPLEVMLVEEPAASDAARAPG